MGQKTSPLILRKSFNVLERSQYFFGRSGNFFLTQDLSMRLNLKKFFRLYKSKLDTLMVLTNDKKIQLFLNFNLKKTRYKRIRFQHKSPHRRLTTVRKKLWKKKRKKMFAVRRMQLRARIFKNSTNTLFYKDFWKTQFQLKLTTFQLTFIFFQGLRPRCLEQLKRHSSVDRLTVLSGILKASNLKKKLIQQLFRKYLIIQTQKVIQQTFLCFFLSKLISYLKILQPYSKNVSGLKQQLIHFFKKAKIPLSPQLHTRFQKLTYGAQYQILKTPKLSRLFIAKFFYFQKPSKRNHQQLQTLNTTSKTIPSLFKTINAYLQTQSIKRRQTQRFKRLLFSKLIYKQKDKKAQRLHRNYKRFTRFAKLQYKVSRIRVQKKFRRFRLFYNRKRFAVFAGLAINPSLKIRYTSKEHLLFRWFKNFYTTPKPRVRDKARPYLLEYSKKILKSPHYLKNKIRLNRYIKRQRFLKKRKLTKNECNLVYLENYDKLYIKFKMKRLKKTKWPSWRRRFWYKRRRPIRVQQTPRRKRKKRRLKKKKSLESLIQQHQTAKQFTFNFIKHYTLNFSRTKFHSPIMSYQLDKVSYKKKAPQHLRYKKFRRVLNQIRAQFYNLKPFWRMRYRFRKRALRKIRKKFKLFRVCYFLYFFNRPMYNALGPMLQLKMLKKKKRKKKTNLKQRRKSRVRRRKTLRVLSKRKLNRLQLVRIKGKMKLLNIWKRILRKQKFLQAQSPIYSPKKRLQKQYLLMERYTTAVSIENQQLKNQIMGLATIETGQGVLDAFQFWNTCFFQVGKKVTSTCNYSLSIFEERPQQRRLLKTFLNKKILYFRTLTTHYIKFLKKKKYLSILFYKKLVKKILQHRLKQRP